MCAGNTADYEPTEQEILWFALEQKARKALENIPELNEPFDFFATGDALGVMKE